MYPSPSWGSMYLWYPALPQPLSSLEEPRDEAVGHSVGVALPVLSIFAAAAVLVTNAAMNQQDGHVNDVEVRKEVSKAAGSAVGQRPHQIAGVVEVARHSPKARREQLAVVDPAITGAVAALDVGWLAPPDGAGAIGAPEQVFLVIGGAENVISQ